MMIKHASEKATPRLEWFYGCQLGLNGEKKNQVFCGGLCTDERNLFWEIDCL